MPNIAPCRVVRLQFRLQTPFTGPCRLSGDTVAELDEKQRPDNNRIGTNTFLNQYFALTPDLESMLLAWARKIVLQHNPPESGHVERRNRCLLCADCVDLVGDLARHTPAIE